MDVFGYELRYAHGAYVMSEGRVVRALPSTVVRVRTEEGIEGWGEACPLGPTYLPAFAGGVRAALADLAPAVLGADPRDLGEVRRRMDATLRGQPAAKSPVDVACWDLLGKATGLPICTLLGGRRTEEFLLYVAVPLAPVDEVVAHVQDRYAEGVRRFQLKLGGDPHEDAARARAVLAATPDDVLVIADANGGWRRERAMTAVRLLDGLDRLLLEQPCPTLDECLSVRAHTTLPFVLDEVVVDLETLLAALAERGLDAVNLKIGRVGGLTPARAMRDVCEATGLRMTIEDAWGGDVVTAAVSHLAASTAPEALLNVAFMNDWTLDHVAGHEPRSSGGRGRAPRRPGLGIEVDVERLGDPLMTFTSTPAT